MSQITAFVLGGGGGSNVLTLTGNSGGAVGPTAGNINVVGTGSITVTGNPGTSTLTISSSGSGITSITGDSGGAQSGPAITLTGGTSGGTFAGAANTLTLAFTELNLPTTTNSTHGVININSVPVFHAFGTDNIFVGSPGAAAGNFTLTADSCAVFGGDAGVSLTSASASTFVGWGAGANVNSGVSNTFCGYTSGVGITNGQRNCAYGMQSLVQAVSSASYNAAFGWQSGINYTGTESSNVVINAPGTVGQNNTLVIGAGTGTGNQQLNAAFISGIFGKTVGVSGVPVVVDNTDQLGTVVSSERYKDNILDMEDYSDEIMDLRCVKFNYKNHSEDEVSVGLIAEEVEDTFPQLVVRDREGNPETVKYLDLIPMLLNEVQKLKKTIDDLESRLEELED